MMHITQSEEWGKFRSQTANIKKVIRFKTWQIFFSKVPFFGSVAYIPRTPAPTTTELDELKAQCQKENALFIKFEPLEEMAEGIKSKSILPRHTIYIDLTKPEGELLSEMHEKTRYNIRLAQKKGVTVQEEHNPEKFIELLESTEKRQGFYSHYPDYYRKLWEVLRPVNMVYILSSYPYAAIMLFRYRDTLYYPYGGSDPKYKDFQAPSLLHFEAMKLGKKLGCKIYDLWGSYKNTPTDKDPWWGIYRFKKGFGGAEITFPESVDIPLSPLYKPLMLAENFRWKLLRLKKWI